VSDHGGSGCRRHDCDARDYIGGLAGSMDVGSRHNREGGSGFSGKRAPEAQREACSPANKDLPDFYLWIWDYKAH
jgi:hypothetical protein